MRQQGVEGRCGPRRATWTVAPGTMHQGWL